MKYIKREKNSDLIAALHSYPLDTSSFILIAVRLIERSVPAHEMSLVRQIQKQYLIQDYHGAINGILSFDQFLPEEYQQLLKKISKNLTDDPVNSESRRFYETAYAEKLESDIKKENNFTVFQELANTYIDIAKKQNITISHNLNSIEDILSRIFKLNDLIELGLKQKSDSYQKKDRDRKEYGNVITKNPGIIKSVSPNFSDNLLTGKRNIQNNAG